MTSLKDKIRQASDRPSELMEISAWGVTIEVRSMTAQHRANMIASTQINDGEVSDVPAEQIYRDTLRHCCFDPETGESLFNDDDVTWLLAEKNGQIIDDIAQTCLRISGLTEGAEDDMGKDS